MELSSCSQAHVKPGSYLRPVPKPEGNRPVQSPDSSCPDPGNQYTLLSRPQADGRIAHGCAIGREFRPGTDSGTQLVLTDEHLLTVLRYIERNAVGAGLVARAEHWRWSGLWARMHGEDATKAILSPWPLERPVDWTGGADLSAKTSGLSGRRAS